MKLAERLLGLSGWKFDTPVPTVKKYVCLAYPHTSNWDGVVLLAVMRAMGLDMRWMIKDDWLRGPMGPLLRRLGAVAVNRRQSTNLVEAMVDELKHADAMALVIPPEGTRSRAERWKSGFYHIARGANVPIVPGYLDFKRKRAGLGPPIELTGNPRADMDRIRAYYATVNPIGHDPSAMGPIRIKEEDQN